MSQVQDTVNILRGIKEKYEGYHGVRIADRALVVAAELSHRYIQNRFLPDKAIDLMDEAASNMRVQLESKPEDIDMMQRSLYRLQVEEQALSKEKDKAWPLDPPVLMNHPSKFHTHSNLQLLQSSVEIWEGLSMQAKIFDH